MYLSISTSAPETWLKIPPKRVEGLPTDTKLDCLSLVHLICFSSFISLLPTDIFHSHSFSFTLTYQPIHPFHSVCKLC